jgi:hypothetical protein
MDKATAAGKSSPSAAMVKASALEVKAHNEAIADERAVNLSIYVPVKQWMREKKLTPTAAHSLVDALDSVQASIRTDMLRLQITAPAVIRRLAESSKSETYAEIVKTGRLQFESGDSILITVATVQQVQALFSERAKERRMQGHAVTTNLYVFSGRVVERDPKTGTITLKVSPGALDALPMGVDIGLDARWEVQAAELEEAA